MIKLANQLRDKKLLAKKITEGYYSNSFKVIKDGKEKTEYGIFVRTTPPMNQESPVGRAG